MHTIYYIESTFMSYETFRRRSNARRAEQITVKTDVPIVGWLMCWTLPETVSRCCPSQLLPADSIATKLKELAQKRFVLVQMGISGLVGCLVVGVMSFFSLDVVKAARIIDTMISVTAIAGVSEKFQAHVSLLK